MRRLYFRIYLAVLGSLVVSAALAGLTWHLSGANEPWLPRAEFFAEAAQKLLPPADAPQTEQQTSVAQWSDLSGYDIALFDADGRRIADASDKTLPSPFDRRRPPTRGRVVDAPRGVIGLKLPDGRWIMAGQPYRVRASFVRRFGWIAALLGIAGIVGLLAYPVVRRLTRNLEDLEHGVAAFGAGNLSARVAIKGHDEVAHLAATYNQTADRIEALLAAHKSLLANTSHELRTPLTRIRMGLESLGDGVASGTREEMACNIRELDDLIDEILLMSRLEQQTGTEYSPEPVDLVGLAAEECARAGAELDPPPEPLPLIDADAKLMRRLLRNLLDNARKYGGGQPAEVVLRRSGDTIQLDVMDRGPGIPAGEREKIFAPFYRLPGGGPGGTGLGLALVRAIAGLHNGSVTCLPRKDGGSIFRLISPLALPSQRRRYI
jgi:signal transduction histidine kinase